MSHVYHNDLPGYSPDQILHDGCPECERRGQDLITCLRVLDDQNFARAWERSQKFKKGEIQDLSYAETNLLTLLYTVNDRVQRLIHSRILRSENVGN